MSADTLEPDLLSPLEEAPHVPASTEDAEEATPEDTRPVIQLRTGATLTPEQAADKAEEILSVLVAAKGGSRREGQVAMARKVASHLVMQIPLLANGETGVGKSLAYLAGLLASEKLGVVGTHTKALQDQLLEDLDGLFGQINFQPPIKHAVLKGRASYVCLKKAKGSGDDDSEPDMLDGMDAVGIDGGGPTSKLGQEIVKLNQWVEDQLEGRRKGLPNSSGDRTDVPFEISNKAWSQISVSAEECLGKGCPLLDICFAEEAKAEAADADVVIANHAILAIAMQLPNSKILPEGIDAILVDEAHEFPEVISGAFGAEVTVDRLNKAIKLAGAMADKGTKHVEDAQESTTNSTTALFAAIKVTAGKADRAFLTPNVKKAMEACRDKFQNLYNMSAMMPSGDEAQKSAKDRLRRSLGNVVSDLDLVLRGNTDSQVIWVDQQKFTNKTILHASQFEVAETIFEKLIKPYKSVLFTSATLTVAGDFTHIAETAGFTMGPWDTISVPSPFDYENKGVTGLPLGAPDIKDPKYSAWIADRTAELAEALGGRTMLLCPSWKAVNESVEHLRRKYPLKFNLIVHEPGSSFRLLVDRFKTEDNSILIGTMTFWTGVSVEGNDLCGTVIHSLPFPSPGDPVVAAKSEAADRKHGKWAGFERVMLPTMLRKVTQGSGRLIRTVHDQGILLMPDPRVHGAKFVPTKSEHAKGYASKVMKAIPPMPFTSEMDKVLEFAREINTLATKK
jgi:ATP-dependent DNA helicase DinG